MNDLIAAYCFVDYIDRKRHAAEPCRVQIPEKKSYLKRLFRPVTP